MIGLALACIIAAKVSRPLRLARYAKNLPSREFRWNPARRRVSQDELTRLGGWQSVFIHAEDASGIS
jgi:hypothetical protein